MGLAGVKKSTKIGLDPRNTKWINNENGVGHKLLAAQGWTPGQGLGDSMKGRVVNIKTTYKDDTAGIGCTPQHAQEWSGLSAFNDIFARINNDEIVAEVTDQGLRNKDRVIYMETKEKRIGLDVRFVKGETFTSELSKAKFLESLGLGVGSQTVPMTEKDRKKAKKAAKLARREEKAARKARKKSSKDKEPRKKSSSKPEERASSLESDTDDAESTSRTRALQGSQIEMPAAVVIPARPVHGRFASRAKYQRAKLGGRMDAAQLAEILGVKA